MALAAYAVVAIALLLLSHRFIRPLSRFAALVLFLLPFVFTGYALITSRVYGPVDHPYSSQPLNWMKETYGLVGEPHNAALSDLYGQMIPWRKAVQWCLAHGEWPLWNPFILSGDILAGSGQSAPYNPFLLIALLLPVPIGLTFSAAITHFLAALGAFLFAREIGCRESASLIAAAGWTCATSLVFFILWPLGFAWTLLPLVLLGVRRGSVPILMSAFTLLLLSGHPETAMHVVFLAGAYALLMRSRRVIVNGVIAGLLALALSAIFILPILEAAPQTLEYAIRMDSFADAPRGVSTKEAAARLATDLLPLVGVIILALAICAVWRVRSTESWFFAGMAVFGLLAHAEWAPLARALQSLPLFDVALNERFTFAAAFALCVLAALGVEDLLERGPVMLRKPYLLLAMVIVTRGISVGDTYRSFEQRVAYPPIPIFAALAIEPFRITGHGLAFYPGTSALYELEDVRGYQAMTFRRYFETYSIWSIHQPVWFNRVDDLTRPFLSFLNVRYAITWDRDPPPDGWRIAAQQRGTLLFENTRVIERVFVPRHVRIGYNAPDTLAQMKSETDFRERAWIEASLAPHERENGPGTVTFTNTAREYRIDANMQRDGWIVASLPAWKGWRAYLDGQRIETQFANHAFLGIHVPAGNHRVRLVYLPRSFVIGRWITFAAVALIVFRTYRGITRRQSAMTHP
ncbi:MAG TPA: YfhO family protein [Thermoanaerobaculia bacterium]|nr:YfhO family protein [Thermoanaerobaculia bacterium]